VRPAARPTRERECSIEEFGDLDRRVLSGQRHRLGTRHPPHIRDIRGAQRAVEQVGYLEG
jgi:hypothetical protein